MVQVFLEVGKTANIESMHVMGPFLSLMDQIWHGSFKNIL